MTNTEKTNAIWTQYQALSQDDKTEIARMITARMSGYFVTEPDGYFYRSLIELMNTETKPKKS